MRVPVPDARDSRAVTVPPAVTPTHVLERATGQRDPERVPDGHGYTAVVHEDEQGRYVGVHADMGPVIAELWRDEYDEYNWSPGDDDPQDPAALIDAGECPWCGETYKAVPQHASKAHPDEWQAYKQE